MAATLPRSPSTLHSTDRRVPGCSNRLSTEPNPTIFLIVGPHVMLVARTTCLPFLVDGHRVAVHHRRDGRRQVVLGEQTLDPGPLELQADEASRRPAGGLLGEERALAVERRRLLEVDQATQAELERGVVLLLGDRPMRAGVLDLDQDEAGLDARDVHRADADGMDPYRWPTSKRRSHTASAPSGGIQSS